MGASASALTLDQTARVYNLPSAQLVRFSQICDAQKRHDSECSLGELEDVPNASKWEVSISCANRLVLRVKDKAGVSRDTWLVLKQDADTIELCTARWFTTQDTLPFLEYQTPGHWYVSHCSLWGLCLRCHGVAATSPSAWPTWQVYETREDRIVLHTLAWFARNYTMSAHRLVLIDCPQTPPTSPRFTFISQTGAAEQQDATRYPHSSDGSGVHQAADLGTANGDRALSRQTRS